MYGVYILIAINCAHCNTVPFIYIYTQIRVRDGNASSTLLNSYWILLWKTLNDIYIFNDIFINKIIFNPRRKKRPPILYWFVSKWDCFVSAGDIAILTGTFWKKNYITLSDTIYSKVSLFFFEIFKFSIYFIKSLEKDVVNNLPRKKDSEDKNKCSN